MNKLHGWGCGCVPRATQTLTHPDRTKTTPSTSGHESVHTMTSAETILARWSTVYVHGGAKDHLTPQCRHCGDNHTQIDAAAYPASHLDLCSWCQSHFETWEDGLGDQSRTESSDHEIAARETRDADITKPDRHEPYRYVCPECEHQVHTRETTSAFYCSHCGESFDFTELYDQKTDAIAGT